ncbi:MAG: PAS domain S-box protein [Deltaproteobacteria bacterium]|nr:PAS domain S-box protein [Deltaproteobacteria bacterium]
MKAKSKASGAKNEGLDLFKKKDIDLYKFFHSSPIPTVISTAKDGVIVEINDSMLKMLNYKREEVLGQTAKGLSIWATETSRKSLVNQVKKSGSLTDISLKLRAKSGDIKEVSVSADHMLIDGDDYLITSFCDVTERKDKEKTVRESEEKYRSIVENSHEGIIMTDDFSKIIFVNDQIEEITGYEKDELLSETLANVFGRNFPKSVKRLYSQSAAGKIHEKLTWSFKDKDKEEKHVEIKVSSFPYEDKKDRMVIQLLDATEGHKAKVALKESEERFFNVMDLANDFVWEVDEKGLFTFVSSRASDITGYDVKELMEKHPMDFVLSEDIEKDKEQIRAHWGERKPLVHMERAVKHKDGHEIILESSSVPFFDSEGVFRGYRGVSRDITSRKSDENILKKREEELEIKTVLLEEANAALKVLLKQRERDKEDIEEKILMNVREMVLPFVEKMKRTKLDVIQEAYINIIESHLDDIISNFLQRIKSKTLTFTPRETQIASLIRAGKNTKEITQMLGMSKSAVEFHRNRIRIKLGLNKKKINLRTSLLSIK